VIGGVTAILGLLLAWRLRAATLVDSRGIMIRGLFGVKHLPWRDIQELSVEQYRGFAAASSSSPAEAVYVYDRKAVRHLLPHFNATSVGGHFALEVERLWEAWQERRGEDWRQTDQVAADVAERERFGVSPWISAA
jgi:hypothetical protein